jgi:hypothetical protein
VLVPVYVVPTSIDVSAQGLGESGAASRDAEREYGYVIIVLEKDLHHLEIHRC